MTFAAMPPSPQKSLPRLGSATTPLCRERARSEKAGPSEACRKFKEVGTNASRRAPVFFGRDACDCRQFSLHPFNGERHRSRMITAKGEQAGLGAASRDVHESACVRGAPARGGRRQKREEVAPAAAPSEGAPSRVILTQVTGQTPPGKASPSASAAGILQQVARWEMSAARAAARFWKIAGDCFGWGVSRRAFAPNPSASATGPHAVLAPPKLPLHGAVLSGQQR